MLEINAVISSQQMWNENGLPMKIGVTLGVVA